MVRPFSLITAALIGTAIGAPATEKSIREIAIEVFGPIDTWTPIYLKDIDPTATIDDLPVNSSVVYSRVPPTDPALVELALSRISSHPTLRRSNSLSKRALTCFQTGLWLPQSQLWSAEVDFCYKAQNDNIGNGGSTWEYKEFWKDTSGNYQHFKLPDGNPTSVFYFIRVNSGYLFNWSVCYNAFFDVIRDCRGSNPDTAGGGFSGYSNGQVDVTIDPKDA
ncbi:hypothetical protein BKA61DRAFT_705059 [Leptodontidium sp. MPI-SDFR-AT-0119]|nr:hypothetical protein BKA61DRAFT_705059 [Leptodontidium sp. MPI-SDFR-AT-0119]